MKYYETKSGLSTAVILMRDLRCANNQPVVVILTDKDTGIQEVHTYTNDLLFHQDRRESTLDLVEIDDGQGDLL